MGKTASQKTQILNWMKDGNSITSLEALKKFGCLRLSGRIFEIRHDLKIPVLAESFKTKSGKIVAKYSLIVKKKSKKK